MKRVFFVFGLTAVLVSPGLFANDESFGGENRASAREFVQMLKAYADSMPPLFDAEMHPFGKADVVFHLEKENFDGSITTSRVPIHFGRVDQGFPSAFAPLQKFFKSRDRLSNIKFDGKTYTMRLAKAIGVPSGKRVSQWRSDVSFKFWEKVPWVLEIEASALHKRFPLRGIKVIYIWKFAEFREYGQRDHYWVPAEVIVFTRERRGDTTFDRRQKWTLEEIRAIEEADVIVEPED
jgi:hypothetical protein